eukprot:scaffold1368_cov333-Pavlova_lutheri.AAC.6
MIETDWGIIGHFDRSSVVLVPMYPTDRRSICKVAILLCVNSSTCTCGSTVPGGNRAGVFVPQNALCSPRLFTF